ncbi:hypothetical protein, partial [Actinomadura harenae]|uniref:hypothetical protein n=1 Tax=Actinomadura harenae TaxID=2483351 RepID=UPI0011C352CB
MVHERGEQRVVVAEINIDVPGRYEIIVRNFSGFEVRRVGDVDPTAGPVRADATGAFHECIVCECCGVCACDYRVPTGHCRGCHEYQSWAAGAEQGLETFEAALASPDGWFVQTGHGVIHEPSCSVLKRILREAEQWLDAGCQHHPYCAAPTIHLPVRAEQLARGKRCRLCAPDVAVKTGPGPQKGPDGRFQPA